MNTWGCSKCASIAVKGYDDGQIRNHFITCEEACQHPEEHCLSLGQQSVRTASGQSVEVARYTCRSCGVVFFK